jgi:glucose/arabinose dehydrogenase
MSRDWRLTSGLMVLMLAVGLLACSGPQAAPEPSDTGQAVPTPTPEEIEEEEEEETEGPKPGSAPTATPRPLPTTTLPSLQRELIAEGLLFPQSLTFAPDGRLFFVEVKKGELRVLSGKNVQAQPVAKITVARGAEHGFVGLALDPGFDRNRYLYTFYTQALRGSEAERPRRNRLTRWTERDGVASGETAVLDDLPFGKCCHTGGKLAFAADGKLFMTLGDQGDASRQLAQNPNRLNGKLLHFDVNRVMRERPDPRSLIYASGLRNPYGLDIHPVTGAPFLTDNGPDNCDELNLGREGANYGNPAVECSPHDSRFDDPIWDSGPDRLGLTGLRIYRGTMFPEYANHALFCAVNTGNLMRAVLEGPAYDRVERVEQIITGADGEGCRLDLAIASDGSIFYASTTKIFRLSRG